MRTRAVKKPPASSPPPLRAPTERGQRTRRALMDAALDLMGQGRSFNSLSLREVAATAGVVPTAFYRHFHDMDALGLALVDDCGRSLRPLLRKARFEAATSKDIIRGSMLVYRKYVEDHPKYFLVASGERHGGSLAMREAIRREIDLFVSEMANDLGQLRLLPELSPETLRNVCDLVVNMMLSAASEILDLPKRGAQADRERMDAFVQQLRVIFMGASTWRDEKPK